MLTCFSKIFRISSIFNLVVKITAPSRYELTFQVNRLIITTGVWGLLSLLRGFTYFWYQVRHTFFPKEVFNLSLVPPLVIKYFFDLDTSDVQLPIPMNQIIYKSMYILIYALCKLYLYPCM